MGNIQNLKLELLRGGPAHNQLLSPLTPYLALCGADGPVTVHVPFEHQQLLTRLERLRYSTNGTPVERAQREAEVYELGKALGQLLSEVPGFLAELSRARSTQGELMHLRLSATAHELALMPFELALGADGFPGSGAPLFLQSIAPIALTREVRRGRPLPVRWNRPPKILFAFATPAGLQPVPAQAHLEALRRAIDPWTKWHEKPEDRLAEVKRYLTVLPNASLQQIRQACEDAEYTHIHILAHGGPDSRTGRFGLALGGGSDGALEDLVEGSTLAVALTARDSTGTRRPLPTVVSLATCDSGNVGSVVTAGGSIAHALHSGGIPWVFASQFPLWMNASSVAAEMLYTGLLRGDDPRWVTYALRQRLRTEFAHTHDWASIVAYAEVPPGFDSQVEAFRNRQTRHRIEVEFDKAEKLAGHPAEQKALYEQIRHHLAQWLSTTPADAPKADRAERLGMRAAGEKRIGNLLSLSDPKAERGAYERACDLYRQALQADPANPWVMTQYLSMTAVILGEKAAQASDLALDNSHWWQAARQISLWQLQTATGEEKAWALGTLAELDLLGVVYAPRPFDFAQAKLDIARSCRDLRDVVGKDAFPVASTRRQFHRYRKEWQNALWDELAVAALEQLPEGASWAARPYLGPDANDTPT